MKNKFLILFLLIGTLFGCGKKNTTAHQEDVETIKIYNLVILDRSGSMMPLREAAVQGYNETLDLVRKAQEQYGLEQQNLITLVLFNHEVTNIFDCDTVQDIPNLSMQDYNPDGMTAMFDAIGKSLYKLKEQLDCLENATAVVTIISDGLENASVKYNLAQVVELIDQLKEQSVMFVFMGTNQNVEMTAAALHIDEYKVFDYTSEGMKDAWQSGINASERYYEHMVQYNKDTKGMSKQQRNKYYREKNEQDGWFNPENN